MKRPVDIKIQIDPKFHDPVILIRTDQKTQAVENIVHAIEACTDSSYPLIAGYRDSEMELRIRKRRIFRPSTVLPWACWPISSPCRDMNCCIC